MTEHMFKQAKKIKTIIVIINMIIERLPILLKGLDSFNLYIKIAAAHKSKKMDMPIFVSPLALFLIYTHKGVLVIRLNGASGQCL